MGASLLAVAKYIYYEENKMTNNYFCLTKPGFLTQNLKDSIYLSIHFYLQSQGKASWGRL